MSPELIGPSWRCVLAAALLTLACAGPATAAGGKLRLTGGVSSVDGAAGGGLTPWALIGSQATEGETGATAFVSRLRTQDYALTAYGVALGWNDRLELSLARQSLDTGNQLTPLGLPGLQLRQDIVGLKWRVAGEALLDSDTPWPQVAVGLMAKRLDAGALTPTLTGALGARTRGTEVYLSASKLLLAQGVLLNATLRATSANQGGLLGFGAARGGGLRVQPELSLAWLLRRDLAVGVEWRSKADRLRDSALGAGALAEDDWRDLFVAWAPSPALSFTLAWVDLGRIVPAVQPRRQHGAYLSVQAAF